jgi:S-adenosylmethionine decarboxylase
MSKIQLHGFNNLTKSLSFSLYKLHYLNSQLSYPEYHKYINQKFCADRLNAILITLCNAIGGTVLNVAKQDYQPQGASVTLMISEEAQPESLVAHLDKSHLCIHTYPDDSPQDGIATFRADIELSTCGVISPFKVLNYIIEEFNADVVDIDYRVRGMTRDKQGKKLFNVDNIEKISDFFSHDITNSYHINESNFTQHNLFYTKLSRQKIALKDYLFKFDENQLSNKEKNFIVTQLHNEIAQLFTTSP